MKRLAILVPAFFFFALATDAQAGPRIVTPRLLPDENGDLRCAVVNASAKKAVEVEITIYQFDGDVADGPTLKTVLPNESAFIWTDDGAARHCAVVV